MNDTHELSSQQKLDLLVSLIGALNNCDRPSYWAERDVGGKDYRVMVKIPGQDPKDLPSFLKSSPGEVREFAQVCDWGSDWSETLRAMVEQMLRDETWKPVRRPEQKKVTSTTYNPPSLLWNNFYQSRHLYWSLVSKNDAPGRECDQWIKKFYEIVSMPFNQNDAEYVQKKLVTLFARRPDFEEKNGVSFALWARHQKKWLSFFKKNDVSFRLKDGCVPAVAQALLDDGVEFVKMWSEESQLSPSMPVPSNSLSDHWWRQSEKNEPGSMWMWAARWGAIKTMEFFIKKDPDIVGEKDGLGRNALHWLCRNGHEDAAKKMASAHPELLSVEDVERCIPSQLIPVHLDDLYNHLEDVRLAQKKPEKNS